GGGLVPRMSSVDRVAERVGLDERLGAHPIIVEGAAEQNTHAQVDLDQVGGEQLAVDHDARRDEHFSAKVAHVFVAKVAGARVLEGPPTTEQDASPPDLFVAGQGFVEEVEQV